MSERDDTIEALRRQNADLQAANNAYRERAIKAEAELKRVKALTASQIDAAVEAGIDRVRACVIDAQRNA